jgi:cytoskeleton protein RodZ
MNKQTTRTQPTAAEILMGPKPGETLRRAREARNLTMEDIWSQTRLSPRIIQAIEQDAYEQLPSPSYVRGYIRNYARVIGIDGESLVNEYNQVVKPPAADLHDFLSRPRGEMNAGGILVKAVSWGLGALMLGLVYMWGQNHYFSGDTPTDPDAILSGTEAPASVEAPAPAPTTATPPGTGSTAAPPATANAPAAPGSAAPAAPATGPATATNPPAQPAAAPPGVNPAPNAPATTPPTQPFAPPAPGAVAAAPGTLPPVPGPATGVANAAHNVVLNIEKESWIEIRDKTGSRLYYKTANPGETINLAGAAPLKVIIGRYPGVNVSIDGRPVDFARFVRGGTAKFNLAEDGSAQ